MRYHGQHERENQKKISPRFNRENDQREGNL